MYEVNCEGGGYHFTVRSKDMDEVIQAVQAHTKRIHKQETSREDARKLVHEVNTSRPAM